MAIHPIRIPVLAASGVAAAIVLAACGSSGGSYGSSPSSPSSAAASSTATGTAQQQAAGKGTSETVTETEFHIALSFKKLKPGTYTFHVKNAGKINHALTVNGPGVANKGTGDISAGSSGVLTVTLKAGTYDIYCPVGNHKMQGMDEMVQVT